MTNEEGFEDDGIPAEDSKTSKAVQDDVTLLRRFVRGLTLEELKDGSWFVRLLTFSLSTYEKRVDAAYFREKYPHLPPDAVAQERISLAAKYAALEGGMSSTAYTGAVAATIGSGGGASPLTLPAGGVSFVVDMTYTTQLQLRMAYDLAVIYGVPLELDDPQDLWKLVKIAIGIRTGEIGSEVALKGVPAVVRPLIKKFFSGSTLVAAKNLPVVGKYLLQRNAIKFAIPAVGVPLTVGMNYWTTRLVGQEAQRQLRREAKTAEAAERLVANVKPLEEMVWAMVLVMQADKRFDSDETTLLHHVTRLMGSTPGHESHLAQVRQVIEVDQEAALGRIHTAAAADPDAGAQIYHGALLAAAINGELHRAELTVLQTIAGRCGVTFDRHQARALARAW